MLFSCLTLVIKLIHVVNY